MSFVCVCVSLLGIRSELVCLRDEACVGSIFRHDSRERAAGHARGFCALSICF